MYEDIFIILVRKQYFQSRKFDILSSLFHQTSNKPIIRSSLNIISRTGVKKDAPKNTKDHNQINNQPIKSTDQTSHVKVRAFRGMFEVQVKKNSHTEPTNQITPTKTYPTIFTALSHINKSVRRAGLRHLRISHNLPIIIPIAALSFPACSLMSRCPLIRSRATLSCPLSLLCTPLLGLRLRLDPNKHTPTPQKVGSAAVFNTKRTYTKHTKLRT